MSLFTTKWFSLTLQQLFFRKLSIYFIRNVASVCSRHSSINLMTIIKQHRCHKHVWSRKISLSLKARDTRNPLDLRAFRDCDAADKCATIRSDTIRQWWSALYMNSCILSAYSLYKFMYSLQEAIYEYFQRHVACHWQLHSRCNRTVKDFCITQATKRE